MSRKPKIVIATCERLPEPDPDHQPLVSALASRGIEPSSVAWDGGPFDASGYDVCVLRATWNYYRHVDEFLAWCRSIASQTRLVNPYPIVAWNVDKHYLSELECRGVPIVPTEFISADGDSTDIAGMCDARGWREFVLKPVISAASYGTRYFTWEQMAAAQEFLGIQRAQRAMMLQPFIQSTRTVGERCVAWIDGEITHTWRKRPRFAGEDERVEAAVALSPQDAAVVRAAIESVPFAVAYARVDLMYDEREQPVVSELELIEPSLYFAFSKHALDRFADMLVRTANSAFVPDRMTFPEPNSAPY